MTVFQYVYYSVSAFISDTPEERNLYMQNKKKLAGLIVIILLTIIAVVYVAFAAFFRSHFSFGTSIDGIPVGGYGIEKVEELIRREVAASSLSLVMR